MVNLTNKLSNKIKYIIDTIDLNYVIAEAKAEQHSIKLIAGNIINKNRVMWTGRKQTLAFNYNISRKLLKSFIKKNQDKVIRLNTKSTDDFYKLNRNTIIYFPSKVKKIKSMYKSINFY